MWQHTKQLWQTKANPNHANKKQQKESSMNPTPWLLGLTISLSTLSACTTTPLNNSPAKLQEISQPPLNQLTTAGLGDSLLLQGAAYAVDVITVKEPVKISGYTIKAGDHIQLGYDDQKKAFDATKVKTPQLREPMASIAVFNKKPHELCIISSYRTKACAPAEFELNKKIDFRKNSFQQTLIYSGKVDNKLRITYREYNNDMIRASFENDVEYDLSESRIIGYKGAKIQIFKATNQEIKYKVIKNFTPPKDAQQDL